MTTLHCTQCQYEWVPNPKMLTLGRTKPVSCPRCQSRRWDTPLEADSPEGLANIREWEERTGRKWDTSLRNEEGERE